MKPTHQAIVWGVFLAVLLGASWYKSVENQRDRARQAAWQQKSKQHSADSRTEYDRLREWFQTTPETPLTRAQLESDLNAGTAFVLSDEGDRAVADWTHPKYGIQTRLFFENDLLRGWNMSGGPPLTPVYTPRRYDSVAEWLRTATQPVAILLWLLAVALASVRPRWGWPTAQFMMACSVVYGAATVVSPRYSLTVRGIFSNDPMFWGVLMYVASLAALAKFWPDDWNVPRFRVRGLMVLTAVVAVLAAMGPLGYFAFCVFAVGVLALLTSVMLEKRQRAMPASKEK